MEKSNMEYRQNRVEMYPMARNRNVDGTKLEHETEHKIAQRQNTCAKFPTQWNEAVHCTVYNQKSCLSALIMGIHGHTPDKELL